MCGKSIDDVRKSIKKDTEKKVEQAPYPGVDEETVIDQSKMKPGDVVAPEKRKVDNKKLDDIHAFVDNLQ